MFPQLHIITVVVEVLVNHLLLMLTAAGQTDPTAGQQRTPSHGMGWAATHHGHRGLLLRRATLHHHALRNLPLHPQTPTVLVLVETHTVLEVAGQRVVVDPGCGPI